jgi:predicted O-linked N-acetylglucosamine transferase (SPINDLY family)
MPGERIRLAYVSADLHDHATARLLAELIELHDRERFAVMGVSLGPDDGSAMRRRLIEGFDEFIDARELDDAQVVERMRAARIDIAVDLKGHTAGSRPGVFARRPAPVQVAYLGYPGTSGASFIDYLIADEVTVPPAQRNHYTEHIAYLPGSYQVNDRRRPRPSTAVSRAQAGLPAQGFVFCCFNNSYKILPGIFDHWMNILRSTEGSTLWLLEDSEVARRNLQIEAQRRGIDSRRLVFAPRVPLPEHLARHQLADLFLDTLPVNAHTTASDALWAGLPVLTSPGSGFAARVAASLLYAVGLPELVAGDLVRYEELAVELAGNPGRLRAIRELLARNVTDAALFDTDRFRLEIEAIYEAMWRRHLRGETPADLHTSQLGTANEAAAPPAR